MRSLRAVGSTIHSMIKFSTNNGVATLKTSREVLWECRQIDKMQSSWKETQWHQHMEQMSMIREHPILRNQHILNRRPGKEPMDTKGFWEDDAVKEKVVICNDHPDQPIIINGKLSIECKQKLGEVLRKNVDVFSWTQIVSTAMPRFIMEHQLNAYPLVEPMIHKKRPLNLDQRRVLKEKVFEWLQAGIIRKVQYPGWVANVMPIKLRDDT
ncbi:hypothetical protein Tco_0125636 [Tanacetum coccineum]